MVALQCPTAGPLATRLERTHYTPTVVLVVSHPGSVLDDCRAARAAVQSPVANPNASGPRLSARPVCPALRKPRTPDSDARPLLGPPPTGCISFLKLSESSNTPINENSGLVFLTKKSDDNCGAHRERGKQNRYQDWWAIFWVSNSHRASVEKSATTHVITAHPIINLLITSLRSSSGNGPGSGQRPSAARANLLATCAERAGLPTPELPN
jgi:hypothetical protein